MSDDVRYDIRYLEFLLVISLDKSRRGLSQRYFSRVNFTRERHDLSLSTVSTVVLEQSTTWQGLKRGCHNTIDLVVFSSLVVLALSLCCFERDSPRRVRVYASYMHLVRFSVRDRDLPSSFVIRGDLVRFDKFEEEMDERRKTKR